MVYIRSIHSARCRGGDPRALAPVLAVLGEGVAVRHGRPLSAGRGAQAGAPVEEGGAQAQGRCVRCCLSPASPGLGRRRPPRWPGGRRGAPWPPDGEAPEQSAGLCRVMHEVQGLGGPPSSRWGCRSVLPQRSMGSRRGAGRPLASVGRQCWSALYLPQSPTGRTSRPWQAERAGAKCGLHAGEGLVKHLRRCVPLLPAGAMSWHGCSGPRRA